MERNGRYFSDQQEQSANQREAILRDRYSHMMNLFDQLAQEKYGLDATRLRRLANLDSLTHGENKIRWDALWGEVATIVGTPDQYIKEELKRSKHHLPSQFQEWQQSQRERQ